VCSFDDLDHDECLRDLMQIEFPRVQHNSSNEAFPLIDPFFLDKVIIAFNRSVLVQGIFTMRNFTVEGLKLTEFLDVQSELEDNELSIITDVYVPQITAAAGYKSDIIIGGIKFTTRGTFDVTFSNVTAQWNISGNLFATNDESMQLLNVTSFDQSLLVEQMKFNLTNAFQDPTLST